MKTLDALHMATALRLAERGRYTVHPNPCVGSVIVKEGEVIGRGYHLKAGEAHAEANALREAGSAARGSTVYCTLEPCSFHGRTPSCAESLIAAGVARVVIAMVDPHPKNNGVGIEMLRKAGIKVDCPLLESSARQLNPGHIKKYETGLPFVRLKLAMSLDGKTALANGESRWITGEHARRDVQKLRARSAAIVTGVQTVIDDDPRLTVRAAMLDVEHAELSAAIARPVFVLDPTLRLPKTAVILTNRDTMLVCCKEAPERNFGNTTVLRLPSLENGRLDLMAVLLELVEMDCNEVLFECGATLAGAMLDAGLVDELVIYAAPVVMGADARSLLAVTKIDSMQHLINLEVTDVRRIGADIRVTCQPNKR